MITRLDKNFTTLAAAPMVRERLKELKTRLTENDLLRMVAEQNEDCPDNGRIVICEVEGMGDGNYTSFYVNMLIKQATNYFELSFFIHYIDGEYIIPDDKSLITIARFNEVLK